MRTPQKKQPNLCGITRVHPLEVSERQVLADTTPPFSALSRPYLLIPELYVDIRKKPEALTQAAPDLNQQPCQCRATHHTVQLVCAWQTFSQAF